MKTLERRNVKAYLALIEELLSCPQGEEWIVLRKYGELVNPELVTVMEQVAKHLANSGDIKAATYLHNWAGKLHHILRENLPASQNNRDHAARTSKADRIDDYTELIQALLSCPEGEESEVLLAHQDLIDPELIKIMNQVASQMEPRDPETANYLSKLAADLDRTWIEHHEFEPTYKKEIAPDPWLDEDEPLPNLPATKNDLDKSTDIANQEAEKLAPTAIQSPVEPNNTLMQLLTKVADTLNRLETTLATQARSQNPLWYMEVLEKALTANWILSTDEVEKLIGVKPHCHHDETSFERGTWIFTKEGKIGAQLGWKVSKKGVDN
ncbi:MAG: hypothetical protein AAF298_19750 [Cyanobacteria bacterium P01_A01_bin.40]